MINTKFKKQGFTLIESLLAIGVLIVGILSAFILVIRSLSNIPLIQSRLIAANLAQEGVELIRQKRDTNNINRIDWSTGIIDSQCMCLATDEEVSQCLFQIDADERNLKSYSTGDYLLLDKETGKYGYGSGSESPYLFQRKIEICFPEENNKEEMRVRVFMYWKVKKNNYSLIVEDHLFNFFSKDF